MNEYETERTGIGDEFPDERTMDAQPGLSGGEYPGAEDVTDAMSETLTPRGEDTTFAGALGGYGPEGAMGTIEEGNAETTLTAAERETQYDIGPSRQ